MKNLIFLFAYSITAVAVFPQSMVVQKTDGTNIFLDMNTIETINFIIPCPGTPTVDYEGKTYNTVLIGNQCWLKENLDVGTMINSASDQTNNGILEKYCYNNVLDSCTTYGGLYQWNEAMQHVTTEGAQGICPTGWHIPSYAEFQTLAATVENDGNILKKIGQGSGSGAGTNTSGFSSLLAGNRAMWSADFGGLNEETLFWGSTSNGSNRYFMRLYADQSNIQIAYYYITCGLSIRCIKD